MKKILFILLISLCLLPGVNAETKNVIYADSYGSSLHSNYYITNYDTLILNFSNKLDSMYNDGIFIYNENYDNDFPYYYVSFHFLSSSESISDTFNIMLTLSMSNNEFVFNNISSSIQTNEGSTFHQLTISCSVTNDECNTSTNSANSIQLFTQYNSDYYFSPLAFYDSNFSLINNTEYDIQINNKDGSLYSLYRIGDSIPSVITTINNRFTEVNLDDYEYVILNLKDYSQKNTFESSLQVKGMVGITPVYEFGTIEKEAVTDRCNISYSDFTDYRFFVLKNDLINNAVYYVKTCKEGSGIRFDSTIFNATYISADTVDDPVITVGGNTYHVIPFNKLSVTANSNEENNFVPGQSGSSLTDIIDNASDFASGIWDSVSSFMGLVIKFFNTLPEELRSITIMGFTVLVTIAVIKFIKS